MRFKESINTCFSKYADFKGKATRSEFWWFFLFLTLVQYGFPLLFIIFIFMGFEINVDGLSILLTVFGLAVFVPFLSVSVRRLHDVGRSGWWLLIYLTIIGIPVLIYWLAKGSYVESHKIETAEK
jgi:uncharacterized membrane protein YhaH (DUF805 family)